MEASFYRAADGKVFFKMIKNVVSGSALPETLEVIAEPSHKVGYASAWKEFEKSEEIVVEEAPLLIEEAVAEEVVEEKVSKGKK